MADEDTIRRVERLEDEISKLAKTISDLNTSIAILNTTVGAMTESENRRAALRDKTLLFVVGGLISAVIAWVIKGGLVG